MTVNEVDEAITVDSRATARRWPSDQTREGAEVESSSPQSDRDDRQLDARDSHQTTTARREAEGQSAKGDSKRSLEGPRPIYIKAPKARRAITSRPAANRSRSANKQVKTRNVVHMRRGTRTRSPGQRALGAGQENQETGAGEPRRGSGAQNVGRGRGSRLPFANLGA